MPSLFIDQGKKGQIGIHGRNSFLATFMEPDCTDCNCDCCALELWVRGYARWTDDNGVVQPNEQIPLPNHNNEFLDPRDFKQDSPRITATNCIIDAEDYPGVNIDIKPGVDRIKAGWTLEMRLSFEVRILDICQKQTINVYDFNWILDSDKKGNVSIQTDLARCQRPLGPPAKQ